MLKASSLNPGVEQIGFYAVPFVLDSSLNIIPNALDSDQTTFYDGIQAGFDSGSSTILETPGGADGAYDWINSIPSQEDTNGNQYGIKLEIYTQPPTTNTPSSSGPKY